MTNADRKSREARAELRRTMTPEQRAEHQRRARAPKIAAYAAAKVAKAATANGNGAARDWLCVASAGTPEHAACSAVSGSSEAPAANGKAPPAETDNAVLDAFTVENDARQGERTMTTVYDFLGRFIAYPSEHAHVAHALWCVHCHLMAHWYTTPRLAFMSQEKESGKSRALDVTELLVPGAILSVSISPAALVRRVAAGGVTVLYDEVDALFGSKMREEGSLDVRSILNAGYRRGAKVHRCVTIGKRIEVEELDAFGPVALAGLRDLPDTLASRAIIVRMRRRAADEPVEPFRLRLIAPEGEQVRASIELWARALPEELPWPAMPDGVTDRAAECWEPLLMVADAVGGDWPTRAREAAVYFVAGGRDEMTSPGVELLEHVREAFGEEESMWTDALLHRLHARPESPWNDVRGRPLDDRGLARRLKGFGIRSRDVRRGSDVKKGYRAQDFHDAWRRYATLSATRATSATVLINRNKDVADVADVALNPPGGGPRGAGGERGHHRQRSRLRAVRRRRRAGGATASW